MLPRTELVAMSCRNLLILLCGFCVPLGLCAQSTMSLKKDLAHPARTRNWMDTRLYLGLGPADEPDKGVSEAVWRTFLDHEVTPRFPSGLSVLDVYGEWETNPLQRKPGEQPRTERIRSKLVIIDYPNTSENAARIEAIRAAWKRQTGDLSVLKVTQRADVSF